MGSFFKRKEYETRQQKTVDFIAGVVGWLIINAIFLGLNFLVLSTIGSSSDPGQQNIASILLLIVNLLPWVFNLGLLIYFAFTRYWVSIGALSAFAALSVLVLCAAILFLVYCFVAISQV